MRPDKKVVMKVQVHRPVYDVKKRREVNAIMISRVIPLLFTIFSLQLHCSFIAAPNSHRTCIIKDMTCKYGLTNKAFYVIGRRVHKRLQTVGTLNQ